MCFSLTAIMQTMIESDKIVSNETDGAIKMKLLYASIHEKQICRSS